MYVQERRRAICLILKKEERVSVKELSKTFDVSEATIRRDINDLHDRGLLVRTHGGAIAHERFALPAKFEIRRDMNIDVKRKLAKFVAGMVKPNDTIMMDGGTTTLQVAVALANQGGWENLTLITNSIPIALEVYKIPTVKVILVGGNFAPFEFSTIGPLSLRNIDNFKATKTISGTSGIDLKHGFTEADESLCELKKKILDLGEEKIIVTDSSKFGKIASYSMADLNEVDVIVTDSAVPIEAKKVLAQRGVELIIV